MVIKTISTKKISPNIFEKILKEVSMLRKEVSLLLPQEDVEDFVHTERIKQSYRHAIKEYIIQLS